jgi:2'-5' RNA ligase
MAESMMRTFIAIELPDNVKRGLGKTITTCKEQVASRSVKWVAVDSIHVTLKFLGDVPASRIEDIRRALGPLCEGAPPMRLTVAGLGAFPSPTAPRVLWAGWKGIWVLWVRWAEDRRGTGGAALPCREPPLRPTPDVARLREDATAGTRALLGSMVTQSRPAHTSR